MTYCTFIQLADQGLTHELAEVATPERHVVPDDMLMESALRGQPLDAFDPADVTAAEAALETIMQALTNADALIDGFLRMRKPVPYLTPLPAPVPGIVSVWARSIARYLLHKDRAGTAEGTDPIVRDYRDALNLLGQVRDGKFSLGADDPLAPPSAGRPRVAAPPREFTRQTLRDFGA